jgi:hypothetical protein
MQTDKIFVNLKDENIQVNLRDVLVLPIPDTLQLTAGEDIISHKVIKIGTDGKAYISNNQDINNIFSTVGIAGTGAKKDENITIVKQGIIQGFYNLEIASTYYVNEVGELTKVPPTTGFVLRMGVAFTENTFYVKLGEPFVKN